MEKIRKRKMLRFDKPVKIKYLRKKVRSNFIENIINKGKLTLSYDDFGRGTLAGELHCPYCYKALGHLLVIKVDLNNLSNSLVIGWCLDKCSCSNKQLDLRDIKVKCLVRNVIPNDVNKSDYDNVVLAE